MFIALEGCDGTGKSTLAAAIADEIRNHDADATVEMLHRSQLTRPPLDEYVHDVADYTPTSNRHIVADRWHWGEEVYGPIYREKSSATLGQFRWTELWLASRGATVWLVDQPLERLQKRLEERGEEFLQPEHVELVRTMFKDVASDALTYGGDASPDGDTDELVKRIIQKAKYQEDQIGTLAHRYSSYVGGNMPHTLLVGEKRGGKPPYVTQSAFMPVNGNSGEFLLASLPPTFWRGVALVNAEDEGDKLTQLVDDTFGPRVVALGRAASDVLLDLGIDHGGVPHPQYVRRFHNKKQLDYGFLIREHARTQEMKFNWPG